MDFVAVLSREFSLRPEQVRAVIELLDAGNTVPFIARYRKEATGSLDDQLLRELTERLEYLRSLDKRRMEIEKSLAEQQVLTDELRAALAAAATLAELEDIYRPFRPKRRTRASIAAEAGLTPLAELLWAQEKQTDPAAEALRFVDAEKGIPDADAALRGAADILAERVSDDADIRKWIREYTFKNGSLVCRAKKKDEDSVYRSYYDYTEPLRRVPPHRILAIDRGEREEFLTVRVEVNADYIHTYLQSRVCKGESRCRACVAGAAADAYDRLIAPSVQNELRASLTETAHEQAMRVFGENLKHLLLQPPVRGKTVMGFDPAYRTGCKIAVVNDIGAVVDTAVVYPTPPQSRTEQAKKTLTALIKKHNVDILSIGNGTASKESEIFAAELLREQDRLVAYVMTNESGASVYSASELAAKELPGLDVSLRSAVSIARRLQDPLAELVKIDPKAIGVGQYQHDLKAAELDAALGGVVEDCVNSVGVDVNTASVSLLSYVAGINTTVAKNIVAYREENGAFTTRAQLKKVPRLGPKAFEQCAGFLRIPGGKDLMENTGVHPESYDAARALLKHFSLTPAEAVGKLLTLADAEGFAALAKQLNVGEPTLRDIAAELSRPGRDPRDELPQVLMRSDVMDLKDLQPGMELRGTVRNVTDFGAFVDIGVHRDGLVHISQMAQRRVNHPSEVVRVGDIVTVWVLEADAKTNRISLTMRPPAKGEGNFSTTKSTQTKKLT